MESNLTNLAPLITEKAKRTSAYKLRNDSYIYDSIKFIEISNYAANGWEIHKEYKTRVKIKKLKPYKTLLEDQAWCLFYRMGYPEINDQPFNLAFKRYDGSVGQIKIDVFAKDDETIIILECKSRETRGRKKLDDDLEQTESLKKPISNAIKEHYGADFKPKIIWAYVTNNIIWSEEDLDKAAKSNIRVITENEMQYFDAFIKHMGPAGRYQFLAEFLEDQEIPNLTNIKVPAIRGKLGGEQFYSFVTTPRHLLKIAFVNHQALNHPDGRPAYQRMIAPSRIRDIEAFIRNGGYFPTNILINFTEKCQFDLLANKESADSHIKFGLLHLPNKYKSAWVIDGQHRLYGYSHLDDEWLDQNLAVIAFEKMDTKDEAELFITINHKQKSVQKSVILSLQSDLKWGSSDPKERISALSSHLAKAFNSDPTSPFFQRLVVQGVTAKDNQSLTLPEFVNGLIKSNLIGKPVSKSQFTSGPLSDATDEKTVIRARKFINDYFSKIRDANPAKWESGKASYICVNPGIRAYLLLLADIFAHIETKFNIDISTTNEASLLSYTLDVLGPVLHFLKTAQDVDIYERFAKRFGEVGVTDYFYELCCIIHEKNQDFGTKLFLARRAKQKDERITQTHQDVIKLSKDISDYVIAKLKNIYGTDADSSGEKVWWEDGIENPTIKQAAYSKYQEALRENKDKRLPKEAYLDLINYKEIVKQKNNWQHFSGVFNIPLKNEKKGKVYYLDWLDYLNKIRRVPAHPSEFRGYEEEDYDFIKHIKHYFYSNLDLARSHDDSFS